MQTISTPPVISNLRVPRYARRSARARGRAHAPAGRAELLRRGDQAAVARVAYPDKGGLTSTHPRRPDRCIQLSIVPGCAIIRGVLWGRFLPVGLLAAAAIMMSPGVGYAQRKATAKSKVTATNSYVSAASAYVDSGLYAQKEVDYDTAINLYWKAYALVPHPMLLFDIAQAHRLTGRVEQALTLYRHYLDEDPDGPEARTAREFIAELEARLIEEMSRGREFRNPEQPWRDNTSSAPDTTRGHESMQTESAFAHEDTRRTPGPARRGERAQAAVASTVDREESTFQHREDHEGAPRSHHTDDATLPARVWLGVGPAIAHRQLSFHSTVAGPSNSDFTSSVVRLQGEIYPFALADRDSVAAGLGLAVTYDNPITRSDVSIEYSHHELGVRYRFGFGAVSELSVGLDYVSRQYLGFLPPRGALAVPNVDYSLIAPTIAGRVLVIRAAALFAKLDALVAINGEAGEVTDSASYGRGDLYGFAATGGLDIALSKRFGLRFAFEYSRMEFQFDGLGDLSSNTDGDRTTKEVQGATDRTIGFVVIVDLNY